MDEQYLPPFGGDPAPEDGAQQPAAEPVIAVAAPSERETKIIAAIDGWIVSQIHNSPVSRETDALNHLIGALGDLRKRILEV